MLGQATMVKCRFHLCLYVGKGSVCIICGNGHRTALKSSASYCKSCQRYNFCLAVLKLGVQFWIPYGEKKCWPFFLIICLCLAALCSWSQLPVHFFHREGTNLFSVFLSLLTALYNFNIVSSRKAWDRGGVGDMKQDHHSIFEVNLSIGILGTEWANCVVTQYLPPYFFIMLLSLWLTAHSYAVISLDASPIILSNGYAGSGWRGLFQCFRTAQSCKS